ncbi:MAG: Inner membrane protein YbaL [Parcubacteria group bacterium ADurb.Bin247]|jgi:Kef-type K+ transport system membrane component KefB|nr:MAG: Inner membrane protein YbaL [Parcubacteria group bacterium ADurb.Bin247]
MEVIFELAIIVCIAATLGIIAKILRQPLILAYIVTGIIIGLIQIFFQSFYIGEKEVFDLFSELGVMFLLFLIGLEMNYSSLKTVGKTSIAVGLSQILFTFIFGFLIATVLGFTQINAAYIAIALTFSSTIIVVKLLSDNKTINSLYGKISIGFLLVQDFVVIFMLIILAGLESGEGFSIKTLTYTLFLGIILFGIMIAIGRNIFPYIFSKIARSQELLFITSIAWVFGLVALIEFLRIKTGIGFSIEIAGFLAGLALANSSEHYQIANRIKPLRDFFILIFFVMLGSSIVFYDFSAIGLPIIVLSLFVLIGNPLIVMVIMGLIMGYRKRTSFMSGITVAQVSEFSLILSALGLKLGHINEETMALIAAVGIITITTSTYMIVFSDKLYSKLSPLLSFFERKNPRKEYSFEDNKKPIILVGYDRTGKSIAARLEKEKMLVIDFNPDIIKGLEKLGYSCIYGDIIDPLIFENVDFTSAKMVISTSPELKDNINLVSGIKLSGSKAKIISRAESEEDAKILYSKGCDYVFLPLYSSGQYLGKIIDSDPELKGLQELKNKDIMFINQINKK